MSTTSATSPSPSAPRLDRATPENQGVSSAAVSAFIDAIEQAAQIELHSLMILRHDRVIAEGWWAPYRPEQLHLLYSLSKSFTSTAAGLAEAEGLLSLDDKVIDVFGEHADAVVDERSRRLTLRHLVRMASGHREDALPRAYQNSPDDLVRGFLSVPLDEEPGSIFCYNNAATFVVGAAVQKRSGQDLVDFLTPRLFRPLGIDNCWWQRDTQGRNLGFSGLHLTSESIARFGRLLIDGGRIGDRQLLDPEWLATATSAQTDNSSQENPDWRRGYGYQFWMGRYGYRGDGAYGQLCVVLPEHDAVVVATGASPDIQGIMNRIWDILVPAFGDQVLPADAAAAGALADRLAGLTLTPVGSAAWQPQPVPEPTISPEQNRDPVQVIKVEPGDGTVVLTLDHGDRGVGAPLRPTTDQAVALQITCGLGHWTDNTIAIGDHTLSCAGSAAIGADGVVEAELSFTNTPHRLRLRHTADAPTRSGWITEPLGEPYPENLAIKAVRLD
ncbi:serine hydrolase [Microlunatus sp. Gsoil 973]|uniref:serine hydrolase domain-containing protein n=1 Tax=Microlunatus sp. Gsoil 973 TaxID=2672569 RepID=UPI0012B44B2A|nr:serine hydrolase [Microlunatus sp. Gsoil 973]QGN32955.1 serine hydrolase [Microlunatus sp. Gsoil 973]